MLSRRLQQGAAVISVPVIYQSSLTLWLDAGSISGVADGATLQTWQDISGLGADAVQVAAGLRPIFRTNVLNGHPAVYFDGTRSLVSSAQAGGSSQTIIAVLRAADVVSAGVFRGTTAGALGCRIDNNYLHVLVTNTASIGYSSTPVTADQWAVVTITYSDANNALAFRQNSGDAGSITTGSSVVSGSTIVGNRPEGDEGFLGDIAELLVYDAVLTEQQILQTEVALMTKYGIAATSLTVPAWPVGVTPVRTIDQDFNPPWVSWPYSPDSVWRIAGGWVGTGGNWLDPANAAVVAEYAGQSGGYLTLTSRANTYSGGEIQTQGDTGGPKFGYYETRMLVSPTPGVCDSFFWIGAGYVGGEIDVEFLTDESWINTPDQGIVHFSVHNATNTLTAHRAYSLGFNPSLDFHRYGWLWTSETLAFTVDGDIAWILPNSFDMGAVAASGYIMANTWTGQQGWGGGPPSSDAVTVYDWMRYYADAPGIPPN